MPYCTYCGLVLEEDALFCPSCGNHVRTPNQASPNSPPPVPYYAPSAWKPPLGDVDRKAIPKLKTFSILLLASYVIATSILVLDYYFILSSLFSSFSGGRTGVVQPILPFSFVYAVLGGALVALAFEVVSLVVLRSSFRILASIDPIDFNGPANFTKVLLVALPILGVGFPLEILGLRAPAVLILAVLILLVDGLVIFISYILGPMIGLWRVGSRYGQDSIKIGVILLIIIPFVSPVLFLIGLQGASRKIGATTS